MYDYIETGNIREISVDTLYKDIDEIFICLSPELIHGRYHSIFTNLIKQCDFITDINHDIEEDFNTRLYYKEKEYNKDYCYTTLLGTDSYLGGVLALAYCFRALESEYEFVVLVTDSVSKESLNVLDLYKIKYVLVEELKPKIPKDQYFSNCNDGGAVYNKVYSFALTNYKKVLFIDADCLVVNNIDYVFDLNDEEFCGVLCKYHDKDSFACNLYMCTPNETLFKDLKDKILKIDYHEYAPDAKLFNDNFKLIPIKITDHTVFHNGNNKTTKWWFNKDFEDIWKYTKEFINTRSFKFSYLSGDMTSGSVITWEFKEEE